MKKYARVWIKKDLLTYKFLIYNISESVKVGALGWEIDVKGSWVALIVGSVAVLCYSCDKFTTMVCFICNRLNRQAPDPNTLVLILMSIIFKILNSIF